MRNWGKDFVQRLTKDQRKAQILEAATTLFVKKGYHETKTKDIAAACSISEPVIYKHFRSKDELFFSSLLAIIGETFSEIDFKSREDTEQVLYSLVINRVNITGSNFPMFKRLLIELLENDDIRRYYYDLFLPRLSSPIIGYLDQLKNEGVIKKEYSSKTLVLGLVGMVVMVSLAKNLEKESAYSDISTQDLVADMLQMLLHGILKNSNK